MSVNVKMQGESHELVEQKQFGRSELWSGNKSNGTSEMTITLSDYPSNYDILAIYQNYYDEYPSHTIVMNELVYGRYIDSMSFGHLLPNCIKLKLEKASKDIKITSTAMVSFGNYAQSGLVRVVGIKLGGVINRLFSLIQRRVVLA